MPSSITAVMEALALVVVSYPTTTKTLSFPFFCYPSVYYCQFNMSLPLFLLLCFPQCGMRLTNSVYISAVCGLNVMTVLYCSFVHF